jgi:hypothetical protein
VVLGDRYGSLGPSDGILLLRSEMTVVALLNRSPVSKKRKMGSSSSGDAHQPKEVDWAIVEWRIGELSQA